MAVPKHNESKAKTRKRRAHKDKLDPPTYNYCEECFAPKRPHRVCLDCGCYQSQGMDEREQIIEVWEVETEPDDEPEVPGGMGGGEMGGAGFEP